MKFFQRYRFWIAGAIVIIVGAALAVWGYQKAHPLPEYTYFKTADFNFSYPRAYSAQEYARSVVSVGNPTNDGLEHLVEVVRYQNDPDVPTPESFDTFMKRQAAALCGTDGPIESITCTEVGVTPFTFPAGMQSQKLDLAMVRKNLKSGTTTDATFGPIYVIDTTASSTPDRPLRYSAIFIYPSMQAFLKGKTSPDLMKIIIDSFRVF
jgi:hypothetical protein